MGTAGSFKGLHGPTEPKRVSFSLIRRLFFNTTSLHRFMSEENWYSYHTRARHLEPHARFVRPACLHSKTDTAPANAGYSLEDRQLALYVSVPILIYRKLY